MNRNMFARVVTILILSATSYAQDINKEDPVLNADQDKFITLSQVNNSTSQQNVASQITNAVFIQQIGTNNIVLSNIDAKSSDIKIAQNGNDNKIEIQESAKETRKIITQTGNENTVIDFSFNPNISTNLELIQEGNNMNFERFGTNELSKNLKFKMSGDARTIIVRSF